MHFLAMIHHSTFYYTIRFAEVAGPSFYVSVLGQDSLDGAMTINTTFDPFLDRDRFTLDIAYWDSSKDIREGPFNQYYNEDT